MAHKPRTLTPDQVAALAESVGLPGVAFAQIARGESGYQVGAVGHDPGGTEGLGLWQITTKYNDDIIKRFGGREKLLTDPYANALAAKAIYDRQGIGAWYGTRFLTNPHAHYTGDTSQWANAASPSPASGTTTSAGGASSTAPSAPDLGGQGSDFTGLLAGLLSKPQPQVQTQALQAPAFAAQPVTPKGFQPLQPAVQSQAPAQDTLSSTLSLLQGLQGPSVTAGTPGASTGAQNASDGSQGTIAGEVNRQRSSGFHGSGVLELIYNDGGKGFGIKNGQVVNGSSVFSNVWGEHTTHVHVAAGRKTTVALGKLAEQMGLQPTENPSFGGVDPVHVPGSYHYKGEATDVVAKSGDPNGPAKLRAYARAVEEYNRTHRL